MTERLSTAQHILSQIQEILGTILRFEETTMDMETMCCHSSKKVIEYVFKEMTYRGV